MGVTTDIAWTDATVNFWQGCTKVSAGCKFCYMYRDKERYGQDPTVVVRSSDATFYAPLRKKSFQQPQRVFTCSWSDFFHEGADAWRLDALNVMRKSPHLTYQVLTKRIERALDQLREASLLAHHIASLSNDPEDIALSDWLNNWVNGEPPKNVWLGVTVENQEAAEERLPLLWELHEYAELLFVSFEPLLGPINLYAIKAMVSVYYSQWGKDANLELPFAWAILGGESGNTNGKYRYRPCQIDWLTDLAEQLSHDHYTAVFVKQLGTHLALELGLKSRSGADIAEWPKELQIQNFPDLAAL